MQSTKTRVALIGVIAFIFALGTLVSLISETNEADEMLIPVPPVIQVEDGFLTTTNVIIKDIASLMDATSVTNSKRNGGCTVWISAIQPNGDIGKPIYIIAVVGQVVIQISDESALPDVLSRLEGLVVRGRSGAMEIPVGVYSNLD